MCEKPKIKKINMKIIPKKIFTLFTQKKPAEKLDLNMKNIHFDKKK